MEYRLLGAFEVVSNGTHVELGPPKQRAVLAVLLLHAGEVVSTDHLIEQVWGDHPPRTAAHSVQLYISDLRRSLEPVGQEIAIETRAPGYLLRVGSEYIDLRRFERLVAEGGRASSDGNAAESVSRLEEALGLWRGSPLAEFAYDEFAQTEIRRLEELRLHAIEELAAAELELGRTQDALTALDAALAHDPLRERARELQMIALYRAGRHAQALRAYQGFATLLAEEGLDPSPALRRLQERILLHDPTLAPVAPSSGQARNPYKGLSAFDEEDADDFFGRGELVERLVASLAGGARLVAVVGPSGGGKSSVVNAGLIPALRGGAVRGSKRWAIARILPGRRPLDELGVALAGVGVSGAREQPLEALAEVARAGCGSGRDLLLVIDQFEEVFSAAGEADRDRILDALSTLSEMKDGHARVLLTLRGDFYDRPLLHLRFSRVFVPNV
ncbi:MAG TPA: BTAD domain-containing putative transcriptional regulator, partial [Actinomycetota bacterium]|nr:BTAD domain-containing putative transcriptional regulator [Actinomycetota bacterium]